MGSSGTRENVSLADPGRSHSSPLPGDALRQPPSRVWESASGEVAQAPRPPRPRRHEAASDSDGEPLLVHVENVYADTGCPSTSLPRTSMSGQGHPSHEPRSRSHHTAWEAETTRGAHPSHHRYPHDTKPPQQHHSTPLVQAPCSVRREASPLQLDE
eukprot:Sspe_Gene.102710::Locus_78564_Transcript_1_1_Confidence_1.000_Length_1239::g.102710::m.102710